ncbi:transposable element Tcb2 transposase [Trichonephila clavipes]|nr:transposable element Tcb2 transposase [Trichonephila clavipes]
MIGRRIAARQPHPTCLPELQRVFLDEWCNIPQDQIDNLILSMPRRSRLSASSVERQANQRLHLGQDEVSDWLDAQHSTLTALV